MKVIDVIIICPFCQASIDSPVWSGMCKPCNVLLFPKVDKANPNKIDPIYLYVDLKDKYRVELHFEANYLIVTKYAGIDHPKGWFLVFSTKHIPPDITPKNIEDKLKMWLTFL